MLCPATAELHRLETCLGFSALKPLEWEFKARRAIDLLGKGYQVEIISSRNQVEKTIGTSWPSSDFCLIYQDLRRRASATVSLNTDSISHSRCSTPNPDDCVQISTRSTTAPSIVVLDEQSTYGSEVNPQIDMSEQLKKGEVRIQNRSGP
jgi:hypothetical protein